MRILNVGGGENRSLPASYEGWEQHVLDIDPAVAPDVVCDAREMAARLAPAEYDAVFCSHNLEHFYRHEVPAVLAGFLHVLKPGGAVDIIVPSFRRLIEAMQAQSLDISDTWYRTGSGHAITFHDVLYGWNTVMEQGNLYYAHKCMFSATSLGDALARAGFVSIHLWEDSHNLYARAAKRSE